MVHLRLSLCSQPGKSDGMREYRPNVAALVIDPRGRVLVCERLRFPGAWQFPQGGVDKNEAKEAALKRELFEEVGIAADKYEIGLVKGGYRYEFPNDLNTGKAWEFDGQEQTYFECLLHESDPILELGGDHTEFRDYRWIEPAEFQLSWLPDFKKEVYINVMKDFFEVELG